MKYASDNATLDELRMLAPALRAFFHRRTDPQEVDDLVQDVMINLHVRRARGVIANIEAYVFGVAKNVWRDRVRHDTRRRSAMTCALNDQRHGVEEISPERQLLARMELSRLVDAVENLPPKTRDAFVLLRLEELSYAEVARRMGISVSAVEKHTERAVRLLMRRLQEDHDVAL